VLSDRTTPLAVLDFVGKNLAPERKELGEALFRNPSLSEELREWLESTMALIAEAEASESGQSPAPLPPPGEGASSSAAGAPQKYMTVMQRIHRMSVVQKVKAALLGSTEERMILVRDSNKLVARAVVQSPKLTEREVENFASMRDVWEDVLRLIALNRRFRKVYVVVRALANNPRTPIDVGLHLVPLLNDRDLKWLALNHDVPDVIRHAAERIVRRKEEAAKPKPLGKH
jgi:hypothetical protein